MTLSRSTVYRVTYQCIMNSSFSVYIYLFTLWCVLGGCFILLSWFWGGCFIRILFFEKNKVGWIERSRKELGRGKEYDKNIFKFKKYFKFQFSNIKFVSGTHKNFICRPYYTVKIKIIIKIFEFH